MDDIWRYSLKLWMILFYNRSWKPYRLFRKIRYLYDRKFNLLTLIVTNNNFLQIGELSTSDMQLVDELYLTLRKTIHCQKINIGGDPWKKKRKKKISPSDFRWRRRNRGVKFEPSSAHNRSNFGPRPIPTSTRRWMEETRPDSALVILSLPLLSS